VNRPAAGLRTHVEGVAKLDEIQLSTRLARTAKRQGRIAGKLGAVSSAPASIRTEAVDRTNGGAEKGSARRASLALREKISTLRAA
jgi:hypothetical protein